MNDLLGRSVSAIIVKFEKELGCFIVSVVDFGYILGVEIFGQTYSN